MGEGHDDGRGAGVQAVVSLADQLASRAPGLLTAIPGGQCGTGSGGLSRASDSAGSGSEWAPAVGTAASTQTHQQGALGDRNGHSCSGLGCQALVGASPSFLIRRWCWERPAAKSRWASASFKLSVRCPLNHLALKVPRTGLPELAVGDPLEPAASALWARRQGRGPGTHPLAPLTVYGGVAAGSTGLQASFRNSQVPHFGGSAAFGWWSRWLPGWSEALGSAMAHGACEEPGSP